MGLFDALKEPFTPKLTIGELEVKIKAATQEFVAAETTVTEFEKEVTAVTWSAEKKRLKSEAYEAAKQAEEHAKEFQKASKGTKDALGILAEITKEKKRITAALATEIGDAQRTEIAANNALRRAQIAMLSKKGEIDKLEGLRAKSGLAAEQERRFERALKSGKPMSNKDPRVVNALGFVSDRQLEIQQSINNFGYKKIGIRDALDAATTAGEDLSNDSPAGHAFLRSQGLYREEPKTVPGLVEEMGGLGVAERLQEVIFTKDERAHLSMQERQRGEEVARSMNFRAKR